MAIRGLESQAIGALVMALLLALPASGGERLTSGDKNVGTTLSPGRTLVVESEAMSAMLRADRDKDGLLTREELEQYDLTLARRFKEGDADHDGKLTLSELEKLLSSPQTSASK